MATIGVMFRQLDGNVFTLDIPTSATVKDAKVLIERKTGTPPECQVLVFLGKKMADSVILSEEGVQNETAIMLVEKKNSPKPKKTAAPKPRVKQPSPVAAASATSTSATSSASASAAPSGKIITATEVAAAAAPPPPPSDKNITAAAASVAVAPSGKDVAEAQNPVDTALPKDASPQHNAAAAADCSSAKCTNSSPVAVGDPGKALAPTPPNDAVAQPTVAIAATSSDQEIADSSVSVAESELVTPVTASSASAPSAAPLDMIKLHFRTLDGEVHQVETSESSTFGFIKHRYLQKLVKFPAIQIRIIFCGLLVNDDESPKDVSCTFASCLHITRATTEAIVEETIPPKGELKVNCRYCHASGAQVALRPMCNSCKFEAVMLSDVATITEGESTWNDLTHCRGMCFRCNKDVDIAWGFLCTAITNGKPCPMRRPEQDVGRQMIAVYQPGKAPLVKILNQIYGYAHAGGFEDQIVQ